MRFLRIGLVGAVLALAAVPGVVSAAILPPATIDQDVTTLSGWAGIDNTFRQTFTTGGSGSLVYMKLYCYNGDSHGDTDTVQLSVTVESVTATATCPAGPENMPEPGDPAPVGMTTFVFPTPIPLALGTQHSITFDVGSGSVVLGTASDNPGGEGWFGSNQAAFGNAAFQTFMSTTATPPPTSTVASSGPAASGSIVWLIPVGLSFALLAVAAVRRKAVLGR
jgi:hypothetical protein